MTAPSADPRIRRIVGFSLRLVLFYAVLAAPWPGLAAAYASLYCRVGTAWFGSFGKDGVVRFAPVADPAVAHDSEIVIGNRQSPVTGTSTHNSRITGYLPTVETLALILATPIAWSRRWRALLWGLVISHALIWLRLEIVLLHWFTGSDPWCIYRPGPLLDKLLERAFVVGVVSPTPSFILPLFVWIAATFRRGDLERLLAVSEADPESAPETARD